MYFILLKKPKVLIYFRLLAGVIELSQISAHCVELVIINYMKIFNL